MRHVKCKQTPCQKPYAQMQRESITPTGNPDEGLASTRHFLGGETQRTTTGLRHPHNTDVAVSANKATSGNCAIVYEGTTGMDGLDDKFQRVQGGQYEMRGGVAKLTGRGFGMFPAHVLRSFGLVFRRGVVGTGRWRDCEDGFDSDQHERRMRAEGTVELFKRDECQCIARAGDGGDVVPGGGVVHGGVGGRKRDEERAIRTS